MKTIFLSAIFLVSAMTSALAQCAMCRATLENNLSNGNPGIATGMNLGILYLFAAPYLAVAAVAFFWFKTSRSNAKKELERSTILR